MAQSYCIRSWLEGDVMSIGEAPSATSASTPEDTGKWIPIIMPSQHQPGQRRHQMNESISALQRAGRIGS